MAARKIGAVIALDGEKEFKSAVTACTKSLNTMKSALKLVETQTDGQTDSIEALRKRHSALNDVLEASQKKEEAVRKGLSHAKDDYESVGKQLSEYRTALDKATAELEEMQKSGSATNDEIEKQERVVAGLAEAVEKGERAYETAGNRVEDWQKKLYDAETETAKTEKAVDETSDAMAELEKSTDGAGEQLGQIGEEAKTAGDGFETVNVSLGSMVKAKLIDAAASGLHAAADAAADAAKYVVEVGSAFEASMSKVGALSGASNDQLNQMSKKARELGSTTKFSAKQVADGFSYMSLAGWDTNEMLASIDGVVSLAAASEMDLAEASDMVTDYLSAFGKSASEAGKMADQMAYAQANSNTTVTQLGDAFGNCAANMNASGQSMETTTALLEAFANQGTKGSEAGTKLAAIMRDITANMEDGAIQIGDTSVAVVDSQGNFRDLTDILVDVDAATQGMGNAEKAAAVSTTFTSRSVSGLNMLLNEGVDNIKGYKDELEHCDGAAQGMAETMQDNLQGKLTEFDSAMEGLGIAMYNYFSGPLSSVVELATGFFSGLTSIIDAPQSDLESFIDKTKAANDEATRALENSKTIVSNAEMEVGKLETSKQFLSEVLDNCKQFSETDLNTPAGEMTSALTLLSKDGFGELAHASADTKKSVKEDMDGLAKNGFTQAGTAADDLAVKVKDICADNQGIKDTADALGYMAEQENGLIVVQDEFTKHKITRVINDMSKYVPEVADAWNETTGELRLTNEQLEAYVNNAERAIKTKAYSEALEQAYKAVADAELAAAMAESQHKEAMKEKDNQVIDAEKLMSEYGDIVAGVAYSNAVESKAERSASKELKESNATKEEAEKHAQLLKQVLEDLGYSTEELTGATEAGTQATEDSTEASEEAIAAKKEEAKATQTASEEIRKAAVESSKQIREAYDSVKESAESAFGVSAFDEWAQNEENGMQKMLAAMESQLSGMTHYMDNLAVIRDNAAQITPEFLAYLENLGKDGSQVIQDIADAFRRGDTASVQNLMDTYMKAVSKQDEISTAMGLDALAMKLGLDELGSTAAEWDDVSAAFDGLMQIIEIDGKTISQTTIDSFNEAVQTARDCGIAIPDGLANGLQQGMEADDPAQYVIAATDQLNAALQGRGTELMKIAQEAGINVPTSISNGIAQGGPTAKAAYMELCGLLGAQVGDFGNVGAQSADAMINNEVEGISSQSNDVTNASNNVINAAMKAGQTSADAFKAPGRVAMMAFVYGMNAQKSAVENAAAQLATGAASTAEGKKQLFHNAGSTDMDSFIQGMNSQARSANQSAANIALDAADSASNQYNTFYYSGLNDASSFAEGISAGSRSAANAGVGVAGSAVNGLGSYSKSYYTIGYNASIGMANGIYGGSSAVTRAASAVASAAARVARSVLKIHSPSKVFEEIGDFTVQGFVNALEDGQTQVGEAMQNLLALDDFESGVAQLEDLSLGSATVTMSSGGLEDKIDALTSLIGTYFPEVIEKINTGMVFDMSQTYMGTLAQRTSEQIGMSVRRARA